MNPDSDSVFDGLGYRWWPISFRQGSCGIWQRKTFRPDGKDRSDSLGFLTWHKYILLDRVGYQAEADLDDCSTGMGVRRMTWNPRDITPQIVRMVEEDYARIAGYFELYVNQCTKPCV